MGYFFRVKCRVEGFFFKRWDKKGYFPSWATCIYPYLHWCSGMDDMLVDDPADCFCDHTPEEIKEEARKAWIIRDNQKGSF